MKINDINILWLDLFDFLTYKKKEQLLNIAKEQGQAERDDWILKNGE